MNAPSDHTLTVRRYGNDPKIISTAGGQLIWVILAVVVAGTPHLLVVQPWVPILLAVVSIWRIAATMRGWKLPGVWVRVPLTLLGFLAVLFSYRRISGVDAGSALLLVMIALKLIETRRERDRRIVIFICYFLLFAGFLRDQPIWSMVYLPVSILVTTTALMQNCRFGQLIAPGRSLMMTGRLILQAIPLMLILFFLFPRVPGPFWALPRPGGSGISGLSEQMSPGDITQLGLSDEVAFRVRFDGPVPAARELYWRGPVLSGFDGRRWSMQQPVPRKLPPQSTARARNQGHTVYSYDLTMEPSGRRWLLALETPASWSVPRAFLSADYQLLRSSPVTQRLSYRGQSYVTGQTPANRSPPALDAVRFLPADSNPRTRALAAELRGQTENDRDYLLAVLGMFRRQAFFYTLTPPRLGRQAVDEFLFDTRAGFCEHYASAFAVLARAAGLPARVVTGYQGAEFNPMGEYWIIRQSNAHAWTEVWLNDSWVRFDPTAAVAPERIEWGIDQALDRSPLMPGRLLRSNALVNRLVLGWDAANTLWNRWVLSFGPSSQISLMRFFGFDSPGVRQLVILMATGVSLFLVLLSVIQRQRWRPQPDPVQKAYLKFCKQLSRTARSRWPAECPEHYAEAIAKDHPDLAPQIRNMTGLYLTLRYDGVSDPILLTKFRKLTRSFRS